MKVESWTYVADQTVLTFSYSEAQGVSHNLEYYLITWILTTWSLAAFYSENLKRP